MKVKVNAGWQLGLPESGKLYYEGDSFDAPDELAEEWIGAGQASAVKPAAKAETGSANKAVTASANKATTTTFTKAPAKEKT